MNGGGERIRTAASRPKDQKQEVIQTEGKLGKSKTSHIGRVIACYGLSPVFGTKPEHFWNVFFRRPVACLYFFRRSASEGGPFPQFCSPGQRFFKDQRAHRSCLYIAVIRVRKLPSHRQIRDNSATTYKLRLVVNRPYFTDNLEPVFSVTVKLDANDDVKLLVQDFVHGPRAKSYIVGRQ
jgi:hypothetical protein